MYKYLVITVEPHYLKLNETKKNIGNIRGFKNNT